MDVPQVVDQVIEEPPQASPELKTEGTQPKPSLIQDKLKTVTERSEITSSQMSGSDFLKDEIVDMNIPEFLKKTESQKIEKTDKPSISQAKTAPSDTRATKPAIEETTIPQTTEKQISQFNIVGATEVNVSREKKNKLGNQKARLTKWAEHNLPVGEIQFILEESIVLEPELNSFKFQFKNKFNQSMAQAKDDKLFKEIDSILRKSDGKRYKIEKKNIGGFGNKEYKFYLCCDKERVVSSYSYDRSTSRRNLYNAILKIFDIERD